MRAIGALLLLLSAVGCDSSPEATIDAGSDAGSDAGVADLAVVPQSCDAGAVPVVKRLTTTADPSAASTRQNITQWNWSRALATDGSGGLHLVYTQLGSNNIEYPADKPDPIDTTMLPPGQIFYLRSLDDGNTWSTDRAMTARVSGTDSANVAASGDYVYVVWRAVDAGRLRVFFQSSPDRGVSWGTPIAISDNPAGISDSAPSIAAPPGGASVYVVWADGRPLQVGGATETTKEIHLAASPDHGANWSLGLVSTPDGFSSWTPGVAAAGNAVHVAWTDERNNTMECTKGGMCHEEEYYRRSLDGGQSWGPEVRLTTDPPGMPRESWAPSIAVSSTTVHVAFFDRRSGSFEVYYKRSTDNGDHWEADVLIAAAQGTVQTVRPTIAALDGDVHLTWFAFDGFPANIYYTRSTSNGAAWPCTPLNITQQGASVAARLPHIAVTPSHTAHLVWYDTRNSDANGPKVELYYARVNP